MNRGAAGDQEPYQINIQGNAQGVVVGDHARVKQVFGVGEHALRRLRRGQAAALAGIVLLMLGVFLPLLLGLRPDRIGCMQGDFRIAVAGFAVTGGDSSLGMEAAGNLYLHLSGQLENSHPGLVIEIWGPDRVGMVTGSTPEERARQAEKKAAALCADLVVYGTIQETDAGWEVLPEFSVFLENFEEVEEILGQHQLGSPVLVEGPVIIRRTRLGEVMGGRVRLLSELAVGLAYSQAGQYETALSWLTEAAQNVGPGEPGAEVLALVMGNIASRAGHLDQAEVYYQDALRADPEYARAMIGMGSIAYIRAVEPFAISENPRDVDLPGIEASLNWYQKAKSAQRQPVGARIDAKVDFGIGQGLMMKAYAAQVKLGAQLTPEAHNTEVGSVSFAPAAARFQAVIDSYEREQSPVLREVASEAYARLGLIYRLSGEYQRSGAAYRQAAILATDEKRAELYNRVAGVVEAIPEVTGTPTPTPAAPGLTPEPDPHWGLTPVPVSTVEVLPGLPENIPGLVVRLVDLTLVDPGEVSEEIIFFETGGYSEASCQNEPQPVILASAHASALSNPVFQTCGWKKGELLTIVLTYPDGETQREAVYYADLKQGIRRALPAGLGAQIGHYQIVVTGRKETIHFDYWLDPPDHPGVYALQDGSKNVLVYGFQPFERVRLLALLPGTRQYGLREFQVDRHGRMWLKPGEDLTLQLVILTGEKSGEITADVQR